MNENTQAQTVSSSYKTRLLHPRDITFIEDALKQVGPFGEVHLVVERGRIRFIRTIKSEAVETFKDQVS